jgi:selenium-binding protein 1
LWTTGEKKAKFGYDYWYQPYWDVMVATEWAAPKSFKKGFSLDDTQNEGNVQHSRHKGSLDTNKLFCFALISVDFCDSRCPAALSIFYGLLVTRGFLISHNDAP